MICSGEPWHILVILLVASQTTPRPSHWLRLLALGRRGCRQDSERPGSDLDVERGGCPHRFSLSLLRPERNMQREEKNEEQPCLTVHYAGHKLIHLFSPTSKCTTAPAPSAEPASVRSNFHVRPVIALRAIVKKKYDRWTRRTRGRNKKPRKKTYTHNSPSPTMMRNMSFLLTQISLIGGSTKSCGSCGAVSLSGT